MKFRPGFMPPFLWVFIPGYLVGTLHYAITRDAWARVFLNPISVTIALGISAIWAAAFAFTIQLFYSIRTGEEGVRCANTFGLFRTVPWSHIEKCKYLNFLGLRFLRLFVRERYFTFWIPLFVRRPADFISEVEKYLPVEHAFTRELRARMNIRETGS